VFCQNDHKFLTELCTALRKMSSYRLSCPRFCSVIAFVFPQTADNPEGKAEEEPELPPEVVSNAGGVPIVGMIFESEEKACEYYVSYAGNMGFSVRKGWLDKTSKNSNRSRVYICSREGLRSKNDAKRSCPETRMGCPARIAIKLTPSENVGQGSTWKPSQRHSSRVQELSSVEVHQRYEIRGSQSSDGLFSKNEE